MEVSSGPTVYLAGPITGLSYAGCNDWRVYAQKWLKRHGIVGVSPMRAKEHLSLETSISDAYDNDRSSPKGRIAAAICSEKGITVRDTHDVTRCNLMLAYLVGAKAVSIGTVFEYGGAFVAGKPIITIMEKEGNPHDHAMIRHSTGFRLETLDEGLYLAKEFLLPWTRPKTYSFQKKSLSGKARRLLKHCHRID